MKPPAIGAILLYCATQPALAQPAEAPPKFEAADVHSSVRTTLLPNVRTGPARAGRYEIKTATMVDLIRIAYGFDADKILGGPSWLEMSRVDVIAKLPAGATLESQKQMLQSLLQERFKLVFHKETKPLPSYALIAQQKPQLKAAAGTEESGCRVESGAVTGGTSIRMGAAVAAAMGVPATLNLGPGGTIQYHCRNITMAAFAEGLRGMMGASSLGPNPVVDATGLKGAWNFDIRWSVLSPGPDDTSSRITVFDAVDKQLGLKLEQREVPTPVLVVDSVNEKPTTNPPGTAEMLPTVPPPTVFEVASVKPADPGGRGAVGLMMQPGGRLTAQRVRMRMLIMRAFNVASSDEVAELPAWVDAAQFDITAKAPSPDPSAPPLDAETLAPMLRALLADRFKMTYHTEERQVAAYSLASVKPKLKKADPASRTSCKFPNSPPGTPPGTRVITCQNVTMSQFADQLQRLSPELTQPVLDATAIEGSWDLTLTFNPSAGMMNGPGRGGEAGAVAPASDPSGSYTIFEAMERQLGLKLEKQKRPIQVFVIDHLEQKPTDN
jgi:uncharacterized protein (TIGR03435 family)